MIDTKQNDLLTRDEVLDLLSIRRSALYQLMGSHGFPRPIKVLEQSNRSQRTSTSSKGVLEWQRRKLSINGYSGSGSARARPGGGSCSTMYRPMCGNGWRRI